MSRGSRFQATERIAKDAGEERPGPRVSVVITTYNHAHFLAEALESVLTQTHAAEAPEDVACACVDPGDLTQVAEGHDEVPVDVKHDRVAVRSFRPQVTTVRSARPQLSSRRQLSARCTRASSARPARASATPNVHCIWAGLGWLVG